jgi:hypothetical protein
MGRDEPRRHRLSTDRTPPFTVNGEELYVETTVWSDGEKAHEVYSPDDTVWLSARLVLMDFPSAATLRALVDNMREGTAQGYPLPPKEEPDLAYRAWEAEQEAMCRREYVTGGRDPVGTYCARPNGHAGKHRGPDPYLDDAEIEWSGGGFLMGDPVPAHDVRRVDAGDYCASDRCQDPTCDPARTT